MQWGRYGDGPPHALNVDQRAVAGLLEASSQVPRGQGGLTRGEFTKLVQRIAAQLPTPDDAPARHPYDSDTRPNLAARRLADLSAQYSELSPRSARALMDRISPEYVDPSRDLGLDSASYWTNRYNALYGNAPLIEAIRYGGQLPETAEDGGVSVGEFVDFFHSDQWHLMQGNEAQRAWRLDPDETEAFLRRQERLAATASTTEGARSDSPVQPSARRHTAASQRGGVPGPRSVSLPRSRRPQ